MNVDKNSMPKKKYRSDLTNFVIIDSGMSTVEITYLPAVGMLLKY